VDPELPPAEAEGEVSEVSALESLDGCVHAHLRREDYMRKSVEALSIGARPLDNSH
jgi:hypothetical protein